MLDNIKDAVLFVCEISYCFYVRIIGVGTSS